MMILFKFGLLFPTDSVLMITQSDSYTLKNFKNVMFECDVITLFCFFFRSDLYCKEDCKNKAFKSFCLFCIP